MSFNKNVEAAAKRLREASKKHQTCAPVRSLIGETDIEKAYTVQAINTALRVATGAKIVGSKIGLTSLAVQQQLGVDQPDFGILFDDREVWNGGQISIRELMQPKAEAEIAFVLKKDLTAESIGTADVLAAIDFALPSIEIVGSRIHNWDIKLTDTIADNASASHFVLGHRPTRLESIDLLTCKMTMGKNSEVVSTGQGSACMGSPINALVWLANTMVKMGMPMRAGQVILTGALGPVVEVKAGDRCEAIIEGLGSVSVEFID